MHYTLLLDNRDFLFKSIITSVSLYAHLVNKFFYSIITRNNTNMSIIISKHLRLRTISEINYDNYYLVVTKKAELILLLTTSNYINI